MADVRTVNVAREDLRDVMKELGIQVGFDVALEMSGAPSAFKQCVDTLLMGGGMALLGIPSKSMETDWGQIILKALNIKGVYGREMFDTWRKMLGLLKAGLDLRPLFTHRLPFEDYFLARASKLRAVGPVGQGRPRTGINARRRVAPQIKGAGLCRILLNHVDLRERVLEPAASLTLDARRAPSS